MDGRLTAPRAVGGHLHFARVVSKVIAYCICELLSTRSAGPRIGRIVRICRIARIVSVPAAGFLFTFSRENFTTNDFATRIRSFESAKFKYTGAGCNFEI